MLSLIKSSFFQFQQLLEAKKLPFGKVIGYIFILGGILTLPLAYKVSSVFHDIQQDGQKIAAKLPDFTIENNQLNPVNSNEKGFIYQTDSIIFTFDPEGKRTEKDITTDMVGNFLSIGLLKDRLVIAMPSTGASTALLGDNQLVIPYSEAALKSLDGEHIREYLEKTKIPWWMYLVAFLVSLYPSVINLLVTLLFATLGATLQTKMRRTQLSSFENFKIVVFAATLPVILTAVIHFITMNFDSTMFILIATLFIYNQVTKGMTRKEKKSD
ncbi:DUF1189 domain-containing protein [Enterococcus dispar]|uniref:DUF1189 domain-containing protein n=1 Tax=Enterococcus dispar TaxID=44009 RepID=UPI00189C8232|nr:DUF1189 domain-containing protein [Enterococcus dispar]MCU7356340.1 DUF1189 domain-containing protein [Enterococcus dispar]WCG33629.1 DUF1189 domain-containing protein [Enterococcus dispar]